MQLCGGTHERERHKENKGIENQVGDREPIFAGKGHRAVYQLVARRTPICPKVFTASEDNEHDECERP